MLHEIDRKISGHSCMHTINIYNNNNNVNTSAQQGYLNCSAGGFKVDIFRFIAIEMAK